MWADPGSSRTPGLAEMGSGAAAPQVGRLLRAPRCISARVLLSWFLRVPRGGRRWSSRHPFWAGERFSACARVRAVAWPARALPRSRPAGTPLAIGSLESLPRHVDVVLHVPPQFTSVVRAQDVLIAGLVDTSSLQLPFV